MLIAIGLLVDCYYYDTPRHLPNMCADLVTRSPQLHSDIPALSHQQNVSGRKHTNETCSAKNNGGCLVPSIFITHVPYEQVDVLLHIAYHGQYMTQRIRITNRNHKHVQLDDS